MTSIFRLIVLFICIFYAAITHAQVSAFRTKKMAYTSKIIVLDSLSIFPNSVKISCKNEVLNREDFTIDYAKATVQFHHQCKDSFVISYRVLPMNLSQIYAKRDTTQIFKGTISERENYLIESSFEVKDIFGGSSIQKAGSISRGLSFGNNQNLGLNSNLNLELSGEISPNLKLLASLSDDNLPIQPDGNTNKLQEFDQLFIQVYNQRFKLIAGDFWLTKPLGYFLNYKKRAQGLTVNYQWGKDSTHRWSTQVSGAFSKGKFARQIIPGIEGNQGPYRLRGNENEPFIIILAGTERVYIDGKLLERGQEFDYSINYNSAEVTFTSRHQITKDSRIVIEFQYSDQNYARSLLQTATNYTGKKMSFWLNAYSEQDAKNQTIQQSLTADQKQLLSEIGDSLSLAQTSSVDSVGYLDNQLLYRMVDTIGYDSVLVFSVQLSQAIYRASFTFVGSGKGDYVLSNYNALGKVFKWIAPVAGVKQGDYAPFRIIVTPKQKQLISSGIRYSITPKLTIETEIAYSKNDINTFSTFNSRDDHGFANMTRLTGIIPFPKNSPWKLVVKGETEIMNNTFSPIEQYRSVEFDRDWNTRNKSFVGNQFFSSLNTDFIHAKNGNLAINVQHFKIGTDYTGIKSTFQSKWNKNGFSSSVDASYLFSQNIQKNEFLRHKVSLSKTIKRIKIGYQDDHELNKFELNKQLSSSSYQFFDYQFFVANNDTLKNNFKLFYRERYDLRSDTSKLVSVAKAKTTGIELKFNQWNNQNLTFISSYRELAIQNKTLINQAPEKTMLGRIDYELRLLKGAFTWNTFYEIGSGLELRKEFLYIQVNAGQGIYTWIDYNGDGVKDLNEFEIAQFADQASYIRVFTPSNQYTKTYSNELNQSIYWRPERIWSAKKNILKFAARFSDQARIRITRKTSLFDGIEAFNPFSNQIRDTSLIASNSNIRNTLFFNRTSSLFGADYTYQNTTSKALLASGFDSKSTLFHEISMRWNIAKVVSLESKVQIGTKDSYADYTSGRNYSLTYYFIQPSIIYQPSTKFRITLDNKYSEKNNSEILGGETAVVREIGSTFKYNETEKGSLQGGFKIVNISFSGNENSALGFEMLEALKQGVNYTWNIGYQRSVSKNLQISLQYNGRKSENTSMIHAGGMEVRAFF